MTTKGETAFEKYYRTLNELTVPLERDQFRSRLIARMCELAPEEVKKAINYAEDSVLGFPKSTVG